MKLHGITGVRGATELPNWCEGQWQRPTADLSPTDSLQMVLIVRGLIVLLKGNVSHVGKKNGDSVRFGNLVRKTRQEAGLSQEELAHRAGLDRSYIGGVERGERNPTLIVIAKIANGLGITLSQLFARFPSSGKGG